MYLCNPTKKKTLHLITAQVLFQGVKIYFKLHLFERKNIQIHFQMGLYPNCIGDQDICSDYTVTKNIWTCRDSLYTAAQALSHTAHSKVMTLPDLQDAMSSWSPHQLTSFFHTASLQYSLNPHPPYIVCDKYTCNL